jgi:outer membrane receptor protein involved in Fe transport
MVLRLALSLARSPLPILLFAPWWPATAHATADPEAELPDLPDLPASPPPPEVLTPADPDRPDHDAEEYSLDQLKALDLPGLLAGAAPVGTITNSGTNAGPSSTPASVTTITAEDIRLTPARNIYDLLEVFVPGTGWFIHSEGPHPGFRGIISDRNNKFLLLVDGRLMNQKGHSGAITELENWDLSDIAQIDVLRGPGSVTYGPGAIAGVISITTKSPRKFRGSAVRVGYTAPYSAFGAAFETVFETDRCAVYAYASRVATAGSDTPHFYVDADNHAGYLGESAAFPDAPARYFRDYDGSPQVKAHLDVRFGKAWSLWTRFTSSGASAGTTMTGTANAVERYQTGFTPTGEPVFGPPVTHKQLGSRQFTTTLQNEARLHPALVLRTMVSFSSLDWRRRLEDLKTFTPDDPAPLRNALTDPDNLRMFSQRFAETELFGRIIANYNPSASFRSAIGAEASQTHWGPGWGDPARKFRMGDGNNIISGSDSEAYGFPDHNGVDPSPGHDWVASTGFGQTTGSLLGELDARPHPRIGFLLSGRADKTSRAQLLLSPRVALVARPSDRSVVKLIWQRAERLNTAEQLFYQKKINGTRPDPEVLTGTEAIASWLPTAATSVSASAFYNSLQVIGWNVSQASSLLVGRLHLAGAELEAAHSGPRLRFGLNHSFVKQVSWNLYDGVTQSGISYAEYRQPTTRDDPNIVIRDAGNDLNNWATHATKLYLHATVTPWLTLHVDARAFWGYAGAREGLVALERAVAGSSREGAVAASLQALRDEDAYGLDLRANASAHVALSNAFAITFYGMNLVGRGGFKRYAYDAGNVRAAPVRSQFMREPLTLGAKLTYSW